MNGDCWGEMVEIDRIVGGSTEVEEVENGAQ